MRVSYQNFTTKYFNEISSLYYFLLTNFKCKILLKTKFTLIFNINFFR